MVSKNAKFDVNSNPLKKVQKTHAKKATEKWIFFTFVIVCKSFRTITLFGKIFRNSEIFAKTKIFGLF
jgi:hypothetical protein